MDSQESHRKFSEKYGLPFPLLSDPDGRVCSLYGVYQKKKTFGKEYWGIRRTTFLIDKQGRVSEVVDKVDVATHHRDVLKKFE